MVRAKGTTPRLHRVNACRNRRHRPDTVIGFSPSNSIQYTITGTSATQGKGQQNSIRPKTSTADRLFFRVSSSIMPTQKGIIWLYSQNSRVVLEEALKYSVSSSMCTPRNRLPQKLYRGF